MMGLCIAALLIAGCSADHADLHRYIEEIDARDKTRAIDPLPEVAGIPKLDSELQRNPFAPTR